MNNTPVVNQDGFRAPGNFVEHLQYLSLQRAHDIALITVKAIDGESVEQQWTYLEFTQRVHALAAVLQRQFARGERILVLLDNDEHYAIGMFACFHAGVIAVPVFPPESGSAQHLERLEGIAADAQARGLLIDGAARAVASKSAALSQAQAIVVDEVSIAEARNWKVQVPAADDVAFLQYTSGSTSAPKGVMVTHGCLMANERAIREGLSVGPGDRFGVWSPLFHDMGLIGGLLQPFYSGIPCVLCTPRYFLERPVRWLQMIARHRVSISGGPDFAYRLCLDRIKDSQLEGLDLSSWRVAYTGAEPVRHQTMDAFIARFSAVGFDAGAVYPCYGLAEATLFVTGGQRGAGMKVQRCQAQALASRRAVAADVADAASEAVALVGCGSAPSGHRIRIVDVVSGIPVAAGAIGEIWAAGPSIAAGYWNKPEETARIFVPADGAVWLRTGDLGFWHEAQLFVTGRIKDMIIVRGHNIYPQDIEHALEASVEALRKGRVAAFAVNLDGQEGIGVAAEVSRGLQKLIAPQALSEAIATVVNAQCGQAPAVVALLNPGALPKTSSGKLQRGACRKAWSERTLDAYATFEQGRLVGSEAEIDAGIEALAGADLSIMRTLSALWQELLGHVQHLAPSSAAARTEYPADAHFIACGGNSLAAVQLAARIGQHWGINVPARLAFDCQRLSQQVGWIAAALRSGENTVTDTIARLPEPRRGEDLPLSKAQQRQWFLWQLAPDSTAYHVQGALRITGEIDVDALQRAFAALMLRHESLHTVFHAGDGGVAKQRLQPEPGARLEYLDMDGADLGQALATLQERHGQAFDLSCGPLVRASLMRLDQQSHVLALAMHHIVSDAASMQILIEELSRLYADLRAGAAASLVPPAVQYVDYAAWQQERDEDSAALQYWMQQLAVPAGQQQPVLELPLDHPRQLLARYRARQHRFALPSELLQDLRQHARQSGVTLFSVLLTGFQALLYRYTGQQDIRIGVPVANRDRPELHNVVGFFVNTLVLRARLDGRTSFAELLAQASQAALDAQAHQSLPFERLVEALQPERSLAHSTLFQVMFNHLQENYEASAYRLGARIEELFLPDQEAQFELTLDTREQADGSVTAVLTYARELFDVAAIERMSGHYVATLQAMVAAPSLPIGDFAMLSVHQSRQLQQWGSNPQRFPDDEPVHRLIQRQAQLRPEATALMLGAHQMSYGQLESSADALAMQLIASGVQREQRVGLAMDRSLDMVVALLAILKSGACFVPLDPHYPQERLAAMVEDSGIKLALTQGHVRERFEGIPGLQLLDATFAAAMAPGDATPAHLRLAVDLHPGHLAYVIYTSGSTGRPKGVAVAHGALAEHAQLSAAFSSLTPEDRMLQFATLNFDGFIEQLFPPLLMGATVVLRGPQLWAPEDFLREVRQHGITIADLPTAYWFALIQSFARQGHGDRTYDYGRLREIHIGGEAMAAEAIAVWQQAGLQHVKLLNTYGPTEAVVVASLLDCTPYVNGERGQPVRMPIGHPIAGRRLHVLDENLQPVPAGVSGELYIGGPLLARGYLARPALTAERFVADPDSQDGARLYRTGDLVRWNSASELEYLGRIDHQLKIRGFRVELDEVEAHLLNQTEVRQAIVVAQESRLAAYVCLHDDASMVDGGQLRERLLRALPDYMVPTSVTILKTLPVNPNGKIDRHALPAPHSAVQASFAAPAGELEDLLAGIWRDLLGVERVGRDDNFFELGGHSLVLMQAYERLKGLPAVHSAAVPEAITMVDLFRYPTISALAAFLGAGGSASASQEAQAKQAMEATQTTQRASRQRQGFLPRKQHTAGADL